MPEENVAETHQLNTLRREAPRNLKDLIKDVPLDKLPEVEALLKGIKGSES
jgi:hypothetical protein